MRAVLEAQEISLSGILCPGHVSTVIGWKAWSFLADTYGIPAAVAGFEPTDVLWAIAEIVAQHESHRAEIVNTYPRSVTPEGNVAAQAVMKQVFEVGAARWRGLDADPRQRARTQEPSMKPSMQERYFRSIPGETILPEGCHCGEVIRGVTRPDACPLFRQVCNPMQPIGPCMVSTEGTCAAYYQYG